MLVLEAAAAVTLIFGLGFLLAATTRFLTRSLHARTLDGKIAKKRAELAQEDRYIRRHRLLLAKNYGDAKGEIVAGYLALAEKKREQTHTQLEALLLEKERRDFEDHMKGNK